MAADERSGRDPGPPQRSGGMSEPRKRGAWSYALPTRAGMYWVRRQQSYAQRASYQVASFTPRYTEKYLLEETAARKTMWWSEPIRRPRAPVTREFGHA